MLFVRDIQTASEHELLYTVFHRMTQVFRVNCITYNEVYKLSDNLSHNTIYCFLARTKYMRQRVIFASSRKCGRSPAMHRNCGKHRALNVLKGKK